MRKQAAMPSSLAVAAALASRLSCPGRCNSRPLPPHSTFSFLGRVAALPCVPPSSRSKAVERCWNS